MGGCSCPPVLLTFRSFQGRLGRRHHQMASRPKAVRKLRSIPIRRQRYATSSDQRLLRSSTMAIGHSRTAGRLRAGSNVGQCSRSADVGRRSWSVPCVEVSDRAIWWWKIADHARGSSRYEVSLLFWALEKLVSGIRKSTWFRSLS